MKRKTFKEKVYPVRKSKKLLKNSNIYDKKEKRFSNGVYNIVKHIPRGSVLTYKEVAKKAGRPKAYRAVGNILNKNDSVNWRTNKIPCHRVIRSDGKVGEYNRGSKNKENLLKSENVIVRSRKRSLKM